jgi:hypothetical protein
MTLDREDTKDNILDKYCYFGLYLNLFGVSAFISAYLTVDILNMAENGSLL